MSTSRGVFLGLMALVLACGDDSGHADGGGSGSGGGDGSTAASAASVDDTAGGETDGCDCDDGDPCTTDTCDGGTCSHEPKLDNECRPTIDVEFPPRAATVQGTSGDPTVTVTGTVKSGLGEITSLTLNGETVTVGADGSFSHDVTADVGGNLLLFETADAAGNTRRRVQSFLWSSEYREPMTPNDAPVPEGLGFWLGQESIDDGVHDQPIDDLATLLELALGSFDVNQFADPNTPIASQVGYDVYLTSLELGSATLALAAEDGGIHLTAHVDDILGDLVFDCTNVGCQLAGGDGTGGVSISTVTLTGDLLLSAGADHQLVATLANVDAVVNPGDVEIWSDNAWTDFLLTIVEVFIHDSLVADLEGALEDAVQNQLGPALAGGLSALTLNTTFSFPNLANSRETIPVDLATDFAATDFNDGVAPPADSPPQGGAVVLRAGGYPTLQVTPFDNDGVPLRVGCGLAPQSLALAKTAPLEISLADDTLNELLFAGWRGGLLEFPLPSGSLDGGIVSNLDVLVSGMLSPTVSDCNDGGELLATIGDIQIDATLTVMERDVSFRAYTTLVVEVGLAASDTGVQLDLGEVRTVETELTTNDEAIDLEPALKDLLEAKLVTGLLGQLGTTGFGKISLPQIDLSGQLGLAPGTAVLTIHVTDVVRDGGNSVIVASF